MQLNSVYLYSNKINIFTNTLADWQTERYRQVYNRNLKVYRSVDNKIDLQVRNSSQKATAITGTALVFNILTRHTKDLVLQKDCNIQSSTSGTASVIINQADLIGLESGLYNYSIVQEVREVIDADNYRVISRTPTYVDSQYGTIGVLEINGDVFGEIEPTKTVTEWFLTNPATTGYPEPRYYTSSIIDAFGNTQVPQSLHTFELYFKNNYTGTIKIQGSLSNGGTPSVWVDAISEFSVIDQTTPIYKNVIGKYNFFRVQHYPNTATKTADFTVEQTIFTTYNVSINTPGLGYKVGDVIVIKGNVLGGETPNQDLTITVTGVGVGGTITAITWTGNSYNGVKTFVVSGEIPLQGTVDKVLYR